MYQQNYEWNPYILTVTQLYYYEMRTCIKPVIQFRGSPCITKTVRIIQTPIPTSEELRNFVSASRLNRTRETHVRLA